MAIQFLPGLLAAFGIGAAGGLSERTGEIREEQRRKDFDAFNAVLKAASAGGEVDLFTDDMMKAYKKLGGAEQSFIALREVAKLPFTQEQRKANLATVLAEREQAMTKGAVAGAQRQAVEEGGLGQLSREAKVTVVSLAAAEE